MILVKIGGGESIDIPAIVRDLAKVTAPFLVVHGANALRDDLAQRLGIEVKTLTSLSGVSSVESTPELIDLMMMTYSGLKNKRIVELFQQNGVNAVGLTGIDGGLITGERNSGVKTRIGAKTVLVRDLSGKPRIVNVDLLTLLLSNGYRPIITVPILDAERVAVNTENDDVVALIHSALPAETIVHFIEAPGFMEDPSDSSSLIQRMTKSELESRLEIASGRIKRKLMAIVKLFEHGAPRVIIADGRVERPLERALAGEGTVIGASNE